MRKPTCDRYDQFQRFTPRGCRAKSCYSITETKYKRHAVEVMEQLDTSSVDGIIIAGGDGLVHEVRLTMIDAPL